MIMNSMHLLRCISSKVPQMRYYGVNNEVISLFSESEGSLKLSHIPVMAKQIADALKPKDGHTYLDMTYGSGGHTKYLLSRGKRITIYALDRDPTAHQKAVYLSNNERLARNGQKVIPLLGRFSELPYLLNECGLSDECFDGIVIDCGASSMQFDDPMRGFALSRDGPLDMRMDANRFPNMPTAADVLNTLNADCLAKIFKTYGEERRAKKIAQSIVDSRFMMKSLSSTTELANLVANLSADSGPQLDKLGRTAHPSTRVFQALRIFVNNELNELNYALEIIRKYIKRSNIPIDAFSDQSLDTRNTNGGIIAVLSFHSLEDRIVKQHFTGIDFMTQTEGMSGHTYYSSLDVPTEKDVNNVISKKWKPINKRVLMPSEEEVLSNPRSRSAKLRMALRIR